MNRKNLYKKTKFLRTKIIIIKEFFFKQINRLLKFYGGLLVNPKYYNEIISQRNKAVTLLLSKNINDHQIGITGVVFSKDRPLQLYALIKSYFENVQNPTNLYIIYKASSLNFEKGYEKLRSEVPNKKLIFIPELNCFKSTLLSVLNDIKTDKLFFLVDDIVFIKKLDLNYAREINPKTEILSLRLSPNIRKCYTRNINQLPPNINISSTHNDLMEFAWFEEGNDWSDPWSVDGNILATFELKVIAELINFNGPNSFEASLKSFNKLVVGRKGLCFNESKIINIPLNRVQNEVPNHSGELTAEFLLEIWNQNKMIDTKALRNIVPISPHQEVEVNFINRNNICLHLLINS